MHSSGLIQFQPPGELFEAIVLRRRHLKAVVLCEGYDDERVFKAIAARLGFTPGAPVGVAYAGGIGRLPEFTAAIAALARMMRKARILAVILDSEDLTPQERVAALVRGLHGRGLRTDSPKLVPGCTQLYAFQADGVKVYAAVSGVHEYGSLEKHKIEDHGLKLRILEGKLDPATLERIRDAKQAITLEEMLSDIMEASPENVRRAYPHIACLIELLQERQA